MGWLRIDDRFEEHEKVEALSDAAHRLWLRCGCWCNKAANAHLGGFVPIRKVVDFCAGSRPRALKLAKELVEARGDAAFGHEFGLWETRDGGWQFHDWAQYQGAQKDPPSSPDQRSEIARQAGLASAEARRQKNGSAQPKPRTDSERPERRSTERPPNEPPRTDPPTFDEAFDRTDSERRSNSAEPPDPLPKTQSQSGSAEAGSQDLTGFPPEHAPEAPAAAADPGEFTSKYRLIARNPGSFALENGVQWPEFAAVWTAWCKPFGITEPPRVTQRIDRDITAIIDAFAAGRSLADLLAAGRAAESDEYMQRQVNGGPASFTSAVLMRLLKPKREGAPQRRRGGPPQPDAGVDPFAKHDAKAGAP